MYRNLGNRRRFVANIDENDEDDVFSTSMVNAPSPAVAKGDVVHNIQPTCDNLCHSQDPTLFAFTPIAEDSLYEGLSRDDLGVSSNHVCMSSPPCGGISMPVTTACLPP